MATKRPPSLLRTLRLLAFFATIFGSLELISTAMFYNTSYPTQGIILDFAPNSAAFSPERTPVIAFIDHRNQKQLATPVSALGTATLFLGQKIPIQYNPANPKYFRISTPLGIWGSGVLRLLYGLVPFLLLSLLLSAKSKRPLARRPMRKQKSTIKPMHIMQHGQSPAKSDRPVVRRMR